MLDSASLALPSLAARLIVLPADATAELEAIAAILEGFLADASVGPSTRARAGAALHQIHGALRSPADERASCIDAAASILAAEPCAPSIDDPEVRNETVAPGASRVSDTVVPLPVDIGEDFVIRECLPPAQIPVIIEVKSAEAFVIRESIPPQPSSPPNDAAILELLSEFVVEARQNLEDAEAGLLELESRPDDKESIDRVFRAFHSIKGTAGFVALDGITKFAHAAEGLLSKVRSGQIRFGGRIATLTLDAIDALRASLVTIEDATARRERPVLPANLGPLGAALNAVDSDSTPAEAYAPLAANDTQADRPSEKRDAERKEAEAVWMRVRTDRLDKMIDMVGELVIAQSMVWQDPTLAQPSHEDFRKKVGHAAKIVRELQGLSMSLRMVPLKSTFQRLQRVVRDVVKKTKKDVAFETEGEDTEIDRNMVEVLADPLVHMLRNAVDHGIESHAADRVAAKKPAKGTVRLAAFHAGGQLVLRLSDDGRGMDRNVIAEKAIARGIIRSTAGMTDADILALVFEPGFSTRDVANDISGRGVGMDVVKRGVEGLKGRIEIASEVGKGTTFTIHVPLTLAITDGMLVRVGEERFILPTLAIRTSFRPTAEMLSRVGGRGEFVRVRDEFVSLFRLHHIFDVDGAEADPTNALVVVVDYGEGRSAFVVDELLAQQQVVSKGLTNPMLAVQGVAGGAILGDGRVGLILDPPGLVALAHRTNAWAA